MSTKTQVKTQIKHTAHYFVGGSIDGQPEFCDRCGELHGSEIHKKRGHSPAPWEITVSEGSPNGLITAQGGEAVIAEIQSNGQTSLTVIANARLIAAAPDMLVALAKLVCPECEHELQHHLDKYGCEVERGDREGYEGEVAQAMGPCGCNEDDLRDDYPDFVRAIEALRKAKGAL